MSQQKAQKEYQKALKEDIEIQDEDDGHAQNHQWKKYKEQINKNLFNARFDLAEAQLGYSNSDIKSANQKQASNITTKILKQFTKIQEKELPKYYQSYSNQAKARHQKGLYTKSDLELIKENIELSFSDENFDDKWNDAVSKMRNMTEKNYK